MHSRVLRSPAKPSKAGIAKPSRVWPRSAQTKQAKRRAAEHGPASPNQTAWAKQAQPGAAVISPAVRCGAQRSRPSKLYPARAAKQSRHGKA